MKETVLLKPPFGFRHDLGEGLKIIKDIEVGESAFKLELIFLFGKSIKNISKMKNFAGEFHAKNLLEQGERIPSRWGEFELYFPGTIFREPERSAFIIPCLSCQFDDDDKGLIWVPWHLKQVAFGINFTFEKTRDNKSCFMRLV